MRKALERLVLRFARISRDQMAFAKVLRALEGLRAAGLIEGPEIRLSRRGRFFLKALERVRPISDEEFLAAYERNLKPVEEAAQPSSSPFVN